MRCIANSKTFMRCPEIFSVKPRDIRESSMPFDKLGTKWGEGEITDYNDRDTVYMQVLRTCVALDIERYRLQYTGIIHT